MPVERCWLALGSMEVIGTARDADAEASPAATTADRAQHRHLIDGAPRAAL